MTREEMIDEAVRTSIGPFTMRGMEANADRWTQELWESSYNPSIEITRTHFARISGREATR